MKRVRLTLASWERATEAGMAFSAVIFLAAWAVPIIWPDLPSWAHQLCSWLVWVTWLMVVIDYVTRLILAKNRLRFFSRNILSLLVVLLPALRPLRLLALLPALNRSAASRLSGKVTTYAVGGSAVLVICGAVAILDVERLSPEANITNFADAVWWSLVTISTVGYGDHYPVTVSGRVIAGGLMVCGIALLGAVTASLASWLTNTVTEESEDDLTAIRTELAELKALLSAQQRGNEEPKP